MSYMVVTSKCIGTKDAACAKICPVSCFHDAEEMLVIKPNECICCSLCLTACPVNAIYQLDEVPESEQPFIQRAHDYFKQHTGEDLEQRRVK